MKVGDFITLQRGKTYAGALVGKPGPALLGLGSIVPGGGFRGDYKTYGGECPPELMLEPGDLYVSLKGATKDGEMIGSVACVPNTVPSGRLTQDTVRLVFRERDISFERYLYWLLRTPNYRNYCAARATGSAVVALSREDFLSYPVPHLTSYRKRVVNLLESIDDKIDSNRRIASQSVELIRASVTDTLERGQESISVSDLARFINGGAYTNGATGSGRMVVRIAELNKGPGPSTVYNEIDVPEDKVVNPGDILMSWSGSLGVYRWSRDAAIVNQHIFKVIPSKYPAWLVFERLGEVLSIFQGIARDKATTMGHIQRGHLESTHVGVPSASTLLEFARRLEPLWDRWLVAELESLKLTELSETLLQVMLTARVPDGANLVEAGI